jgi:pyruvate,orthophosphate dikinase
MHVDIQQKIMTVGGKTVREGEIITLNGTKGRAYKGALPMISGAEDDVNFTTFMKLCDSIRRLKIRTNAETPKDAAKAVQFGAEGLGLFRTEHMFYGENSEKPLFYLRKMILSDNEEQRRAALDDLFPFVKNDMKKTMEVMAGRPVTIRLLDPPLHEFVPENPDERQRLAESLGISIDKLNSRAENLHETNPMMGHRGVRLGITYPEVSEMQIRAILEGAAELIKEGKKALPEIMIPVVCDVAEFRNQALLVKKIYPEVCAKYGLKKIPYMVGTMIEIPRAALLADKIAEEAEFFSFGTNDLTQMTYGFSRDDVGAFVPEYVAKKIIPVDPFQILDQAGVGQLIQLGVERGRKARKDLKVGICGEHGGEPSSVMFCHSVGMNYVSCSPYRIPIARLAAAQAVINEKKSLPAPKVKTKVVAKPKVKVKTNAKAKAKKSRK